MQDGSTSQTSSTSSPLGAAYLPSGIRPSNFIKIHREGQDISGTFVIDRKMKFPNERGFHLTLISGSGAVEADVFCVPPSTLETPIKDRTAINISSGRISINLHRPQIEEGHYPVYLLIAGAQNSASRLSLPRSFKGSAYLGCTGNNVTFSPDVLANFTLFSEVDGVTKGFIGDFDHTQWKTDSQWAGDVLHWAPMNKVSSTLALRYDDEDL
ncbi:hypothetical protein CPB83DRAFT_864527 [Crepidotus variabilis]|uniref:DUF7330 domain-containing protein n=1 Tax=Crepidotus variabilis TaxID=179855 RepID=A0A9P6E4K5_9AGAR|nr:hypothetical protein CPB83DRAFT_864527 [Crepidotus variabilis]